MPRIRDLFLRVRQEKSPVRFLLSRILMKLPLVPLIKIRKSNYRLHFYPTALSATLWLNPDERSHDETFFERYLRPGDTVVDVGANIGSLTLLAASIVGGDGTVIAIEPHPRVFRYLLGNLAYNPQLSNVVVHNVALGQSDGEAFFSNLKSDDQNSVLLDGSGLVVPQATLDQLSMPEREIALLKIDVEGYEKFVLQGGGCTLERVACIYFESFEENFNRFGYSFRDIHRILTGLGFEIYRVEDVIHGTPVVEEHVSLRCENLVACRDVAMLIARFAA